MKRAALWLASLLVFVVSAPLLAAMRADMRERQAAADRYDRWRDLGPDDAGEDVDL